VRRSRTIRRQVTAGFAGCLTVILLMVLVATLALNTVSRDKNAVIEHRAPLVAQAYELESLFNAKSVAVRGFALTGDESLLTELHGLDERLDSLLTTMTAGADAKQQATLATVAQGDDEWDKEIETLVAERRKTGSADSVGETLESRLFPAFSQVTSGLDTVITTEQAAIDRAIEESNKHEQGAFVTLWGLAVLGFAAAAGIAAWITRRINGALTRLAVQVNEAAHSILVGVQQQVAGATEQAAAVQQTVATVDELVQTAEQAVDRAEDVSGRAQQSVRVSEEGSLAIDSSSAGMADIHEQVDAIARSILELSQRSQMIKDIVGSVESIADETHLLALNAAIEAARAGEHGRGFSVVAGEVKALADQSRAATAKVSRILGEIEQSTTAAVLATEEGTKSTQAGAELVAQAGKTIQELAETISTSLLAAEQIAASSRQQAAATVQISQAMRNVDTVMEQNVEAARASEQTASTLTEAARQMKLLVGID
jgi:methyl-accepting chemotaxis protein